MTSLLLAQLLNYNVYFPTTYFSTHSVSVTLVSDLSTELFQVKGYIILLQFQTYFTLFTIYEIARILMFTV